MPIFNTCQVCGSEYKVKPSHAHKRKTCGKDCGKALRSRRMSGSGNHQFGVTGYKNSSWKGGRRISNCGYVLIYAPDRSTRSDNYALEHRIVMEDFLGRRLLDSEIVHHINGNKTDNRITNLELMSLADHTREHNKESEIIRCPTSGKINQVKKRENNEFKRLAR